MAYDNVFNLLDLWRETNTVTEMMFSYLFLVTIFIIAYVSLQKFNDIKNAIVAAAFITTMVSVFMFLALLMTQAGMITCITIFAATFFWLLFDN